MSKEESVISKITTLFSNQNIPLQYSILGYKIDLYFPKHRLAIEESVRIWIWDKSLDNIKRFKVCS